MIGGDDNHLLLDVDQRTYQEVMLADLLEGIFSLCHKWIYKRKLGEYGKDF